MGDGEEKKNSSSVPAVPKPLENKKKSLSGNIVSISNVPKSGESKISFDLSTSPDSHNLSFADRQKLVNDKLFPSINNFVNPNLSKEDIHLFTQKNHHKTESVLDKSPGDIVFENNQKDDNMHLSSNAFNTNLTTNIKDDISQNKPAKLTLKDASNLFPQKTHYRTNSVSVLSKLDSFTFPADLSHSNRSSASSYSSNEILYLKDAAFPYTPVSSIRNVFLDKLDQVPNKIKEINLENCYLPLHKGKLVNLWTSKDKIKWKEFTLFENLEKLEINNIKGGIRHDKMLYEIDLHNKGDFEKLLESLPTSLRELSLINMKKENNKYLLNKKDMITIFEPEKELSRLTNLKKINLFGNGIVPSVELFKTFLNGAKEVATREAPLVIDFFGETENKEIKSHLYNLNDVFRSEDKKNIKSQGEKNIKFGLGSKQYVLDKFKSMKDGLEYGDRIISVLNIPSQELN